MFSSRRHSFLFANSAKTILFTVCLAIVLRALVISSYVVETDAMTPSVRPGEFLLAWRRFEPRRGDVVLLPCPETENGTCIKRVVAVAGDRVEILKQRLIVNAEPAEYEPVNTENNTVVLKEKTADGSRLILVDSKTPAEMSPIVVPPDQVFLLNDRRSDSADSRNWGAVPASQLEARAWRIWLSLDWIKNRLNWGRLLQRID